VRAARRRASGYLYYRSPTATGGPKPSRPLLLACALASLAAGEAPIKLGTDAWIANYPADVAASKGFWKAEGVAVELVHFDTDSERANATSSGVVDLGLSMIGSAISWQLDGKPVTIVAEMERSAAALHEAATALTGIAKRLVGQAGASKTPPPTSDGGSPRSRPRPAARSTASSASPG
jgi:hypothetical protein